MNRTPSLLFVVLLFVGLWFSTAGCGETAASLQVRSAAAADLDCDESAVVVADDRPYEKRVEGCGRSLTYVRYCGNADPEDGAWAGRCEWTAFAESD